MKCSGNRVEFGGFDPAYWEQTDLKYGLFDLYEGWEDRYYTNAMNRIIGVGEVGINSTVCGP